MSFRNSVVSAVMSTALRGARTVIDGRNATLQMFQQFTGRAEETAPATLGSSVTDAAPFERLSTILAGPQVLAQTAPYVKESTLLDGTGRAVEVGADSFTAQGLALGSAGPMDSVTLWTNELLVGAPVSDVMTRAAYTPGIKTTGGAVNLGTGATDQTGEYFKIGANVFGTVHFRVGSASAAAAGTLLVELPSTPSAVYVNRCVGAGWSFTNATSQQAPAAAIYNRAADGAFIRVAVGTALLTNTWVAVSNQLSVSFAYLEEPSSAAAPVVAGIDPFQRVGATLVTSSPFTITTETAVASAGAYTLNLPSAAANLGQIITVYALSGNVTLNATGGDVFALSGLTTETVYSGTVIQFLAFTGSWVALVARGEQFDIPPWLGLSIPQGKPIVMGPTQPQWGNADALYTTYTPTTLADWSGVAPATIGDALDRIAAHVGPIP